VTSASFKAGMLFLQCEGGELHGLSASGPFSMMMDCEWWLACGAAGRV
jgi:hypothetical protein